MGIGGGGDDGRASWFLSDCVKLYCGFAMVVSLLSSDTCDRYEDAGLQH